MLDACCRRSGMGTNDRQPNRLERACGAPAATSELADFADVFGAVPAAEPEREVFLI
jgi:hypothetical protein